ncbi:sigma-70 family RNA polymerase sigma factor [Hyphobacterium sp. HN65]|uniref:RNA polymerase sigma factor n=1 Tax=Hyphobacterium lacteum TaxID=3116575 RepID=A0ABU7LRM9_9PROT|nr:sigma-70 family RNA polymerase sigma factor [Hyphobacterium sp. HN65]MEE2526570.1 sigma-70 family RNA polymerase sigma factor [Hyphobacterium sp. HN65]
MPDSQNHDDMTPSREQLDAWVEACARGDRAAFRSMFEYYAPRVKGYLKRLAADDAAAEELAQEVMLTVWRKAKQFDARQASASTWIFRIARNRRIDMARRAKRPELDAAEPLLQPVESEAPDAAAHARDRESRVRAALKNLPEDQVHLLRLAFFDGLSHSEIAEREGVPLGTVKSRIRLAFGKLRGELDPDDI